VHADDVARILLDSPSQAGLSIDNVAAETLTVADVAALATGDRAAGRPACTFRSRFRYQHRLAEYLPGPPPTGR
jgi:hypothetical protein